MQLRRHTSSSNIFQITNIRILLCRNLYFHWLNGGHNSNIDKRDKVRIRSYYAKSQHFVGSNVENTE